MYELCYILPFRMIFHTQIYINSFTWTSVSRSVCGFIPQRAGKGCMRFSHYWPFPAGCGWWGALVMRILILRIKVRYCGLWYFRCCRPRKPYQQQSYRGFDTLWRSCHNTSMRCYLIRRDYNLHLCKQKSVIPSYALVAVSLLHKWIGVVVSELDTSKF